MFDALNHLIEAHAAALWVIPAMFALATVDGFFPPLPSESVLIGLAAVSATTGDPAWLPLGLAAAVGAVLGDNIAYEIGRHARVAALAARSRRVRGALARAERHLARRGAVIIVVGRYVPVGRVAVNLTAGATRYPRRRFAWLTVLSGVTWAAYSLAVGRLAGAWIEDNPVLGAITGIAFALVLGVLVERSVDRFLPSQPASTPDGTRAEVRVTSPR